MESGGLNYNQTSTTNTAAYGGEDADTANDDAFMKEVETLMTFKIAIIVNRYWFAILVPIGLVGWSYHFL